MATMRFTDADRDERGFIRVGAVPPERRRGLATFLPAAAAEPPAAETPAPEGRAWWRLDPQQASTFGLVTAGMVLAAVLLTLLNGLPHLAAPMAEAPAATAPAAPAATGAPTVAADPVVARVYHAPDGAEAGTLTDSVVRAGFDVVGRCGGSAWLRVRPRADGEDWEAWVRADEARLDPQAFTYADRMGVAIPDLCAAPPAPPAADQPAVEAAPPPAPVVEAAPPAAPPPAAAPPGVTPVVVQIQRPSGEVVRLEAQIPAPDPHTAHIPTAVVAAPPPQPNRVIPNPGAAATAIARCGAACSVQPTPSP